MNDLVDFKTRYCFEKCDCMENKIAPGNSRFNVRIGQTGRFYQRKIDGLHDSNGTIRIT